jgi:hypothetical protein
MSKLANLVTATLTNDRAYVDKPFNIHLTSEYITDTTPYTATRVRFRAQFGVDYYIDDDLEGRSERIAYTLDKVRRDVIEEVFGEFRLPLRELAHCLYNRDYDKAMEKLESLEKQMLHV